MDKNTENVNENEMSMGRKPSNMQDNMSEKDEFAKTVKETEDKTYWRSFRELYKDPAFNAELKNEFGKESATTPDLAKLSTVSRRKFLALLSASAAVAATGCNSYQDRGVIVPYNQKPEEITLGLPNYYASTCTGCTSVCGILVKTREGRPIKVDGNPDHPVNKGKICTKGQASIMNLYNPERLKEPMFNKGQTAWNEANKNIVASLGSAAASGKEIAIVTHRILSPTLKKIIDEFKVVYPTTKIYSYEVFSDSARRSAWQKSYGKRNMPALQLDKAKIILALESDFLGNDSNQLEYTRLFMQNRDVINGNEFNRLYAVEGAVTITGMNADYRLRLKSDAVEEFVMCLLNEFVNKKKLSGFAADGKVNQVFASNNIDQFAAKYNLDAKAIKNLIEDLAKNQGSAIVMAGDKLPESTHIAVNLLNDVLGSNKLYSQDADNIELMPLSTPAEMESLTENMSVGKVAAVIHFDTNPVYNLSPEFGYAAALAKVPVSVTLTEMVSETSELSNYVLPVNSQYESWGDFKTRTGFYSLQQPIIAPLFNTRQKEAVLLNWKDTKEYNENLYKDYLTENWEKNVYASMGAAVPFKKFWNSVLHDGVALFNEKPESASAAFNADAFAQASRMKSSGDFTILLQNNNGVGDGRFASNGWLQELPNAITKIVWDNYAAISVHSASELGVNSNDMVDISIGGRKQSFPAY
ncbi:MAG: TAT-variant-translocated molybdopterin oxidoreductase, partial [Ignavibacteria bacterium]|nr:TAT-variant-translocated molybdopterin oxidoreductase [Ignavibacteria bacterium]